MSINSLTGSEQTRIDQILDYWLVFEPIHLEDYENYDLFTAPLGQQHKPELIINSGSNLGASGSITVEKEIHQFHSEASASIFIDEVGEENVLSIRRRRVNNNSEEDSNFFEVHIADFPRLFYEFDYKDFDIKDGFILQVFKSGSLKEGGLRLADSKVITNSENKIISDTYLKFFKIKTDG